MWGPSVELTICDGENGERGTLKSSCVNVSVRTSFGEAAHAVIFKGGAHLFILGEVHIVFLSYYSSAFLLSSRVVKVTHLTFEVL